MRGPLPEGSFAKRTMMFADVAGQAIGAAIGAGDIWKTS
jgi:hypothetical protein